MYVIIGHYEPYDSPSYPQYSRKYCPPDPPSRVRLTSRDFAIVTNLTLALFDVFRQDKRFAPSSSGYSVNRK